jgi:rhodanese-related sulfurtransferase
MKIPLLTILLSTLFISGCEDSSPTVDNSVAAALARRIAAGQDHITASELADRLIRDQRDFELIDIRNEQDFEAGHIESARHIPLSSLLSTDSLESLPVGRTVVVYSNGSAHAAQAALLLQLQGREALALLGGYNYWQAYLHDPEKAGIAEMDPTERARYQAVSCYFAGEYIADAGLLPEGATRSSEPAQVAGQEADPLGLGLGLGTEEVRTMDLKETEPAPAEPDPLGLGLGLGLGEDTGESASEPAPTPSGGTQRLLIKGEC